MEEMGFWDGTRGGLSVVAAVVLLPLLLLGLSSVARPPARAISIWFEGRRDIPRRRKGRREYGVVVVVVTLAEATV